MTPSTLERTDYVTPTRWDVVVVGGANMDYLVRGLNLPGPGATLQGNEFQEAPGGKGANQAVAAARLGARVAFVARVGADVRGLAMIARLVDEGIDVQRVVRDTEASTGVAVIHVDEQGEKQILTAPGANRRLSPDDVQDAGALIRSARVVLTQLEPPLETVVATIQAAHDAGALVVLDPAPPAELPDELLELVDVIRPNAGEARALTGIEVTDRESARRAAHVLRKRGVGVAIVQAGEEGDLVVSEEGESWLPRISVETVDATGAGDAFAAAIAVMLAEGKSVTEAGKFANTTAALTTTKLGAQAALPRREEVKEKMESS
jgi:ribokinase